MGTDAGCNGEGEEVRASGRHHSPNTSVAVVFRGALSLLAIGGRFRCGELLLVLSERCPPWPAVSSSVTSLSSIVRSIAPQ